MDQVHPGGCLCGRTRFEARGAPGNTSYCHCRMCQRSSGAPAQVGADFADEAVTWSVAPATYRSSPEAERLFCPACGSQLAFRSKGVTSINVPCLDRPEAVPPHRHIWCESAIGWHSLDDGLPRHPRGGDQD